MADRIDKILFCRARDMKELLAIPRTEKLIKISGYMPCQIVDCSCLKWIGNEKIDKPSMESICDQSCCNHTLYDHVSNLKNAQEKKLNGFMRVIFDLEDVNYDIENEAKFLTYLSHIPSLKYLKIFLDDEMKHFVELEGILSVEKSTRTPPFESPSIVDILKHFCLHKFSPHIANLKLAFKITKMFLNNFDDWTWDTPEQLPSLNRLKFKNTYNFYYKKYQKHCLTPNSNHPIIKPSYTSSIIFGQDILKYTLKVFKTSFINWCINESENYTFSKKMSFKKDVPIFMDLLEEEVYAVDSPIWNQNFTKTSYQKINLDTLNLKLNELIQSQLNAPAIIDSNIPGRNKNCFNRVPFKIPDVKYDEMDTILNTFEFIHLDISANTSLKGFITNQNKSQAKGNHIGIEMIVFDRLSNFTECVLYQNELRNMYRTQLPRLPDTYIARLETDEQIKTLAMLEDGIPVGGIYFRTFNSQGFTEIVLCMFKIDLHEIGYESRLMNYLKDLHIKQNIWDLLVYADKEKIAYFKDHNFRSEVKISKTKYKKYIVHYEDSKLMHCNLKK